MTMMLTVLAFSMLSATASAELTNDYDDVDISLAASLSESKADEEAFELLKKKAANAPTEKSMSLLQSSASWSDKPSSPLKTAIKSGAFHAIFSAGRSRLSAAFMEPGSFELTMFFLLLPLVANAGLQQRLKNKKKPGPQPQLGRRGCATSRPSGARELAKAKGSDGERSGVSDPTGEAIDVKKHVATLHAMQLQKPRCELGQAIHNAAKKGDVEAATRSLKQLEKNGNATLPDYNAVISLCAKSNDPEGAHRWLQRVAEMGLEANSVCYNAVINAHAKRGELQKAVEVATHMRNNGVCLDTVSYNTIIDACARAGDAESAEHWMREMLDAGVNASVVSFGSVMLACARASDSDKVEHWLLQADRLGIELNIICFSAVINAFAKANELEYAAVWIQTMTERGVKPTIHCFTGMIEQALKNHDIHKAAKLVENMRAAGVEPDAAMFNWLVTAAGRRGDEEQAHAWAAEAAASGFCLNRMARRAMSKQSDGPLPEFPVQRRDPAAARSAAISARTHVPEDEVDAESEESQALVGQVFTGTIKEYITAKFGYIMCDETYAVFRRDVFLSSNDNPHGYAKGQRVTFTLFMDKKRGLPRGSDLKACSRT